MTNAHALYPAAILEHHRAPKNEGALDHPTHEARLDNPLCGDRVTLHLRIDEGHIREVRFACKGCTISRASASILTEAILGQSTTEAAALIQRVHALAAGRDVDAPDLGPLDPLRSIGSFPGRKRCATLAWEVLDLALGTGVT